jgi:hypothetical protein
MDGPGKVAIRDLLHAAQVTIDNGRLDPLTLHGKELTIMIVNDRTPGYYSWSMLKASASPAGEPE